LNKNTSVIQPWKSPHFAMYIMYLDFDGVLHDGNVWFRRGRGIFVAKSGRRLFEWEDILIDLLAPYADVKIVLSTSWVQVRSFNYVNRLLHPSLRLRVIGTTFRHHLMDREEFEELPRGIQILGDVLWRQPTDWFAIDDDGIGWPAWCRDRLVLTQGRFGVSDATVQENIRRRLARWARRQPRRATA
jgi:hypothetical protein